MKQSTRKFFLAALLLAILAAPSGAGLISLSGRYATSAAQGKLQDAAVESSSAVNGLAMAKTYGPDELYQQLKNYPRRGPTIPPYFMEALPLQRLREMANLKELSVVYTGDEKPYSFYTHYSGEGKSLGIAVAVVRPDSPFSAESLINRSKEQVRLTQNARIPVSEVTIVPLGDFGYLEVSKLTPENVPPGFLPPGVSPSAVLDWADVVFVKGTVWVSIRTYKGLLNPEQLVAVARGFEQLLVD